MLESPKTFDAFFNNFGFLTIAELRPTLSAPDKSALSISFNDRIPPDKQTGINISFVIFLINSKRLFLPYKLATAS